MRYASASFFAGISAGCLRDDNGNADRVNFVNCNRKHRTIHADCPAGTQARNAIPSMPPITHSGRPNMVAAVIGAGHTGGGKQAWMLSDST